MSKKVSKAVESFWHGLIKSILLAPFRAIKNIFVPKQKGDRDDRMEN